MKLYCDAMWLPYIRKSIGSKPLGSERSFFIWVHRGLIGQMSNVRFIRKWKSKLNLPDKLQHYFVLCTKDYIFAPRIIIHRILWMMIVLVLGYEHFIILLSYFVSETMILSLSSKLCFWWVKTDINRFKFFIFYFSDRFLQLEWSIYENFRD